MSHQLALFDSERSERLRKRIERAATPTALRYQRRTFDRVERCDCDGCAVEYGYDGSVCRGLPAEESDRIARKRGDKWRQSTWLLAGEQVIRDARLS